MIIFTPEISHQVQAIYQHEHRTSNRNTVYLLELASVCSTYDVLDPILSQYKVYWQFLRTVLKNIEFNRWHTLPPMWVEIFCDPHMQKLQPYQIEDEQEYYFALRKAMCQRLGLSPLPEHDKAVLLHWIRSPKGDDSLIGTAYALTCFYKYMTGATLPGVLNSPSGKESEDTDGRPVFNNANTQMPNLVGRTKMDIIRDNFQNPNNSPSSYL